MQTFVEKSVEEGKYFVKYCIFLQMPSFEKLGLGLQQHHGIANNFHKVILLWDNK